MKKLARFVALIAASVSIAGAAFAQGQNPVYRVKDLAVDAVGPSAADAGLQGRNQARVVGAQRLIDRLTLPEDRSRATQPIEASAVAQLYRGYVTQGEMKSSSVSGGIRATGVVTWNFDDQRVRAYLEQRGVPYVDSQAGLALIVPVAAAGVNANDWAAQWVTRGTGGAVTPKSDETLLTPFIASTRGWPQRPTTADIQDELSSTGAVRGVTAEAYMQGPSYYVRLTDLRAIPNPSIGVVGPFTSLASAQAGAIAEMERAWKAASVVRSTGSTSVSLVANFSDLQQWARIRKGLEGSRLVQDLNIESISVSGADITFSYAGRPDQLQADLRSRGVNLQNADGGWVLQAAQ